jgi:hypothetical protein
MGCQRFNIETGPGRFDAVDQLGATTESLYTAASFDTPNCNVKFFSHFRLQSIDQV